jgi:hypothetical protein
MEPQTSQEILSIAVMEPIEGKEQDFIEVLRDFYQLLRVKRYSRDQLMRNRRSPHYVNIRYWASEQARQQAHEDPEVHRFWAKLGLLCQMRAVYETLEPVEGFLNAWEAAAE